MSAASRWSVCRRRDDAGASAVEFGLITIPLFTLLIGIIQFSIWFWAWQAGAHGVREGARQYAVDPCGDHDELIVDRIGAAAAGVPSISAPAVVNGSGNTSTDVEVGDELSIEVSFQAFEIGFFPFDFDVTQSATTRIEYVPTGSCS